MSETDKKNRLSILKAIILGCLTDEEVINNFIHKNILPNHQDYFELLTIPDLRMEGADIPQKGYSMIGVKRMDNLHNMLDYVRINNIKGDLIETGVWKGGATIFMQYYNQIYNMNKKVFVCDSFEGLPKPSGNFVADEGDLHHTYKELSISLEEVKSNFEKLNCLSNNVVFVKGFFNETLPNNTSIKEIALLRMDGDMYESTHDVFYSLYHKVSNKGVIIVDDYCLPACQQCVSDFRVKHEISKPINFIDRCGIYWFK